MRVGQQALGHRHRQVRNPAALDEVPDRLVGLRVGRALAQHDQRPPRLGEHPHRAPHRLGLRQLPRGGVDDPPDRRVRRGGLHRLAQDVTGDVEVHAARTSGDRRPDGARHAAADVLHATDPVGRLRERPCGAELVEILVVAALQVDHRPVTGTRDLDHREAVGGRIGQRGQAVEKAGPGRRQAHPGPRGEEAGGGGRVAGRRLLPKADVADARRLRPAREVGDRDPDDPVDRLDAVRLQGIHDELEAVGQPRRRGG